MKRKTFRGLFILGATLLAMATLAGCSPKPKVRLHYDCSNYGTTMKYKLYEDGMMDLTTDKGVLNIPYVIISDEVEGKGGIVFEFGTGLDTLRVWLVQGSMITSVDGRATVFPCKVLD